MNYPFEKEQAGALATASFSLVMTAQTGATQTMIWLGTGTALCAMSYSVLFPFFKSTPNMARLVEFAETQKTFWSSVLSSLGVGFIGATVLVFFAFLVSLATAFGAFVIIDVVEVAPKNSVDQFVQLTIRLWQVLLISSVACGFLEAIAQCLKHDSNNRPVPRVFFGRYLRQNSQLRLFASIVIGSALMGLIYTGDIALKSWG